MTGRLGGGAVEPRREEQEREQKKAICDNCVITEREREGIETEREYVAAAVTPPNIMDNIFEKEEAVASATITVRSNIIGIIVPAEFFLFFFCFVFSSGTVD